MIEQVSKKERRKDLCVRLIRTDKKPRTVPSRALRSIVIV